uniref:Zgc:152891 n=1 Tax=Myripristis murdjan TaxID=586833 RepID=A0A667ZDK3_9TELE
SGGFSCQEFEVVVHTSPDPASGTYSLLRLSLIGSEGETPPLTVNEADQHLVPGSSCVVRVRPSGTLGRLLLVRLRLEPRPGFPDLDWHCRRVEVRAGPEDPEVEAFMCERWLRSADGDMELRSGEMCLLSEETEEKLRQQRSGQLQRQQERIRWRCFVDGAPHCVDVSSLSELDPNLRYGHQSAVDLQYLRGFTGRVDSWTSFTELQTLFALNAKNNHIAKYVQAHWRDDWFFGYQCVNGCNPLLLRRTRLLPPRLAVTPDMLRPFLPEGSSLEQELERGSVYLLDYELLDGVPANVVNGRQTFLCAPLCLLHLDGRGRLQPVAIQLQQTPGPHNPVFLPSDPACDWLLAKMWVQCCDFQCHQLVSHYLQTHMLGELCCTATLRQLPEVHPLHQLLMPHVRSSLQINVQARASLLAANGVFDKAIGCGLEAVPVVLSRAAARLRYRSLCVPDDVADRGVDQLPHSLYAQDALRVWDALHRFVSGWIDLFYAADEQVQVDCELQNWIREIHTHGFNQPDSGFPQCFQTKAEVSRFVTALVFCCSALHAAVNFSQLDFSLWMPNRPAAMFRPPPQEKGGVTEADLLSLLPDVGSSCSVLATLTLLAQPSRDFVSLCDYQDAAFRSGAPRRLVEDVQAELRAISDDITERNRKLELPYPYLCPTNIENSVAI